MKGYLRVPALALAVLLLAGCTRGNISYAQGPGSRQEQVPDLSPQPPQSEEEQPAESQAPWTDGLTPAQQKYGSAGLLAWPCVLYCVYLEQPGGPGWTQEEIDRTQENLAVAVDWIGEQAAEYNAAPTLYYGEDLMTVVSYNPGFVGGEDSDEGQAFYEDMDAVCGSLRTRELAEAYGTSNIGFLVFLPVSGCSFTMVHYLEDGGYYFNEYCCLYKENVFFDPGTFDGPAVYAHEILHLFGAPDLYNGSNDLFVTEELVDYVAENWPDEIMQDTYAPDGSLTYGEIDKIIGPLTAYRLGLSDSFPGMERFPLVTMDPPGTFRLDEGTSTDRFDEQDGAVAA